MSTSVCAGARCSECLLREGWIPFFSYPGVTLPLVTLYDRIKHILVRHEQNACFAAQGYARATGKVGVCCATSGPGATNLVTALVDALMDFGPIVVAITNENCRQADRRRVEADTSRSCTKHEQGGIRSCTFPTSRPAAVRVRSRYGHRVFQAQGRPTAPVSTIHLPGYKLNTEGHAGQIRRAAEMIWEAEPHRLRELQRNLQTAEAANDLHDN